MPSVRERAVLVRRLATDRRMPQRWRIALWALLAYLASPIDLIPDFFPVLGQLDDLIIAGVVLRGAMRAADRLALDDDGPPGNGR